MIEDESKVYIKNCIFDKIDSKSSIISVHESELTLENIDFNNCITTASHNNERNIYAETSHITVRNASFASKSKYKLKTCKLNFKIIKMEYLA